MSPEVEAISAVAVTGSGTGKVPRALSPPSAAGVPTRKARPPESGAGSLPDDVGLVFEVNQESHELIIKIVDRQTQEIIREIPPEEVRQMRATMQSALGLFLDRTG